MIKDRSTKENRKYWDYVEKTARWVNAHHLCYSNMCIVHGGDCDSPNTIDRKTQREMDELDA